MSFPTTCQSHHNNVRKVQRTHFCLYPIWKDTGLPITKSSSSGKLRRLFRPARLAMSLSIMVRWRTFFNLGSFCRQFISTLYVISALLRGIKSINFFSESVCACVLVHACMHACVIVCGVGGRGVYVGVYVCCLSLMSVSIYFLFNYSGEGGEEAFLSCRKYTQCLILLLSLFISTTETKTKRQVAKKSWEL